MLLIDALVGLGAAHHAGRVRKRVGAHSARLGGERRVRETETQLRRAADVHRVLASKAMRLVSCGLLMLRWTRKPSSRSCTACR